MVSEKQEMNFASMQDSLLETAWKMMLDYKEATGTKVYVLDHRFMPIPQIMDDIADETNLCLFCLKYRSCRGRDQGGEAPENAPPPGDAPCAGTAGAEMAGEEPADTETANDESAPADSSPRIFNSPCNAFHINAMMEAHRFRGSYIYMCDLGFMFWTSPVFSNGRFAGALLASGCLGIDRRETINAMYTMGRGAVSKDEITIRLREFPQYQPERVKALAELLLMCAQSLSVGNESYHETLGRRADQQIRISRQMTKLKALYPDGPPSTEYPLDKERLLLEAIRGDGIAQVRDSLDEYLGVLIFSYAGQFKQIRYRLIELLALLSRTAFSPGHTGDTVMETAANNLRLIQEAQSIEELTDVLYTAVETMAAQLFSFRGFRHAGALRKAERFIWNNYTRKISLREIASQAGLSAPYFSTVFKEEMGENLSCYLNRLRVERAGRLLLETSMTLTEIAASCGFEDQSWFSKIFKNYTGMSPGKFRNRKGGVSSEISEQSFSEDYRSTVGGRAQR